MHSNIADASRCMNRDGAELRSFSRKARGLACERHAVTDVVLGLSYRWPGWGSSLANGSYRGFWAAAGGKKKRPTPKWRGGFSFSQSDTYTPKRRSRLAVIRTFFNIKSLRRVGKSSLTPTAKVLGRLKGPPYLPYSSGEKQKRELTLSCASVS